MDLLKETYRIWAMYREFRTVLAELNSYFDRELTEPDLGRGDLARVAYEEAERRILTRAMRPSATEKRPRDWRGPASIPVR